MQRFWKPILIGSLILLLVSGGYIYFNYYIPSDIALNSVEVQDLNGKEISLTKYIGKPLVVNYWASWCVPCLREFPDFESVKQAYGDSVNFVMISSESIEKITRFSKSKPYTFNYLKTDRSLKSYGITFIPTSYFYDSKGNLVAKESNGFNKESLKAMLKTLE